MTTIMTRSHPHLQQFPPQRIDLIEMYSQYEKTRSPSGSANSSSTTTFDKEEKRNPNNGKPRAKRVKDMSPNELMMYNEDKKRRNTMNARRRRERYRRGDAEIQELYDQNEKRIKMLEKQIKVLQSQL